MIIGISGKSGSGKDTLANILKGAYPEMNFQHIAFADKVKVIAGELLSVGSSQFENREYKESWVEDLNISVRGILQAIGDGLRDKIHPDIWLIALQKRINPSLNYLVTDCRYKNEAEAIKKMGGIMVYIDRYASFNEWSELAYINEKSDDDEAISKEYYIELLKKRNKNGKLNNELERLTHSTENGMVGFDDYDFQIDNTTIQEFHLEAISVASVFSK